jgi:inosine-uridine nucleoside N-ribohydrolase
MSEYTPVLLALILAGACLSRAEEPAAGKPGAPIPVILDTDIGDDIDDTWALVQLLKSPQFDLKLVTTTYGKAEYRAKLIAKLLTAAGRTDVPVGLGAGGRDGSGGQQAWVQEYKLSEYPKLEQDGVKALVDTVNASQAPITIIAIGPLNTLAAALERDPGIAAKVRLAAMQGSVRKGYNNNAKPDAEYNVKVNVPAAQKVFAAPWREALITPLDTCGLVTLSGKRFETLRASKDPLTQTLLENYRIWAKKKDVSELKGSSVLFDTVAVYLANPGPKPLVELESLQIAVTPAGMTVVDPGGKKMEVATKWLDLNGYCDHLVTVLTSDTVPAKR